MKHLVKFDQFFAWILFATMILFLVSGYGMTKGIISNKLAIDIHNQLMPPVLIVAFTTHAWFAIHMAFKRWRIWNWFSATILALFFIAFVGYFGYLQYFYQQNNSRPVTSSSTSAISTSDNTNSASSSTSATKTFSLSELAKYNGQNGQPSYVAVDGKVYDLSSVFINGNHRGWSAGQDLSNEFHLQHLDSILNNYTIVGTLAN